VAILLGGGNLGEDIIQDSVNIWGLKFNYFVANSLMFLSFVSLLTLVIRVRNKFID
jgi:hypothetical protein